MPAEAVLRPTVNARARAYRSCGEAVGRPSRGRPRSLPDAKSDDGQAGRACAQWKGASAASSRKQVRGHRCADARRFCRVWEIGDGGAASGRHDHRRRDLLSPSRRARAGHIHVADRPGDVLSTRLVRSKQLGKVKAIQMLLSDVYKDAGDGRTLLRELVQNADDAGAQRLVFGVFDRGWPQAGNSLLRGPALMVAIDGPFLVEDREALHQAIGGSKAEDTGKVGRFGVGLKSVFHICGGARPLRYWRRDLQAGRL